MSTTPSPYDRTVAAQRLAADPALSAWVSANAGAGKTRVLTDRVIRLMLAGTRPSEILSITFTKAAAAEMSNRLFQRLGAWATASDADLRAYLVDLAGDRIGGTFPLDAARRLFARALEAPGGLKIQTIHAFAESVLGRFPLEAGLTPGFQVLDEVEGGELMRQAQRRLHEPGKAPADVCAALDRLLADTADSTFDSLLSATIFRRGQIQRSLERHGDVAGIVGHLRSSLGLTTTDTLEQVRLAGLVDGAFDELGLRRTLQACGSDTSKSAATTSDVLAAWLASDAAGRTEMLDAYLSLYLTGDGAPRKRLLTAKTVKTDPTVEATMADEQVRVLEWADRMLNARIADRTGDVLTIAVHVLANFARQKRQRGLLDFQDQIDRTLDLLRSRADWVHFKLDEGITHILIDEAQDTSPEQWEIVERLSAEFHAGKGAGVRTRTVFAVGDEKQSIYSFQGADPEGFARMRGHFHGRISAVGGGFEDVPLALSFRSAPAILEAVDATFEGAAAQGLTAADTAVHHDAMRAEAKGLVELWPLEKPVESAEPDPFQPLDVEPPESPRRTLARRIADRIRQMIDGGETVGDPGAERAIGAGDVLILVRRRDALVDEMARELKARGVAVAGADRMMLTTQMAVMDLMVLGDFLLLPEDNLALATVLKSPLFNLTDDDLLALTEGRQRGDRLWPALRRRAAENPAWQAAADELAELLAQVDQVTPFDFFSRLLGARRGRERLHARLGPDQLDPLDEFLAAALTDERDHAPSMQGFLHRLRLRESEIKRDMEQSHAAVRIMTVHGAKGLEAPIVFLPDTVRVPRSGRDALTLFRTGDGSEIPVPSVSQKQASDRMAQEKLRLQQQTRDEYSRLLYVAMTRARDRLVVCGFYNSERKPPDEGCWYGSVENALKRVGREDTDGIWRLGDAPGSAAPDVTGTADDSLPPWALTNPTAEPAPPRPLAPSRPTSAEPAAASPLGVGGNAPRRRGNLVHRLLQILPGLPEARRNPAGAAWLSHHAADLPDAERAELLAEVSGVIRAPELAAAFAPGSRAEVSVTGLVGSYVVSGQIDRLAVQDDRVLIVDYKTNRPPPADARDTPVAYVRQMALYRAVIQQIHPGRPIDCVLVWTWQARAMVLPPEMLDLALDQASVYSGIA